MYSYTTDVIEVNSFIISLRNSLHRNFSKKKPQRFSRPRLRLSSLFKTISCFSYISTSQILCSLPTPKRGSLQNELSEDFICRKQNFNFFLEKLLHAVHCCTPVTLTMLILSSLTRGIFGKLLKQKDTADAAIRDCVRSSCIIC